MGRRTAAHPASAVSCSPAELAHEGACGSGPRDRRGRGAGGCARDARPAHSPLTLEPAGPGAEPQPPPAARAERRTRSQPPGPSGGACSSVAGPVTTVFLAIAPRCTEGPGTLRLHPLKPSGLTPWALGLEFPRKSPKRGNSPSDGGTKRRDTQNESSRGPGPATGRGQAARSLWAPPLPLVCGGAARETPSISPEEPPESRKSGCTRRPPGHGLSHVPRAGLAWPPRPQHCPSSCSGTARWPRL